MSRTKTVVQQPVTVTVITCDVCGADTKDDNRVCIGCKKDLCANHRLSLSRHPITQDYISDDYPDYICDACKDAAAPFISLAAKELERHDQEMNRIMQSWHDACRGNPK